MHSIEIAGLNISLRNKLIFHLTSNHYPPISIDFIPTCKKAIKLGNEARFQDMIRMPNGIIKSVADIIEGLHLEEFLEDEKE